MQTFCFFPARPTIHEDGSEASSVATRPSLTKCSELTDRERLLTAPTLTLGEEDTQEESFSKLARGASMLAHAASFHDGSSEALISQDSDA